MQKANGYCGDPSDNGGQNIKWALDNSNNLTISGYGAMTSYSNSSKAPWYSYRNSITSVTIENGVTSIGSYAFSGCSKLSSVKVPVDYKSDDFCGIPVVIDYPYDVQKIPDSENWYIDKEGRIYECDEAKTVMVLFKGSRSKAPKFVNIFEQPKQPEDITQEIERRVREYIELKKYIEDITLEPAKIENARKKITQNIRAKKARLLRLFSVI